MKTIVYQSYRTEDVPGWISRSMRTVRQWADQNGFDYEFIDDRFFDCVPQWFRDKVEGNKLLMSDLARLVLAREFLAGKYQRTIWVDADVLVFDPERFHIDVSDNCAFCREVWIEKRPWRKYVAAHQVNNSVSLFVAGNSVLDFYIDCCERIIETGTAPFHDIALGTTFLTDLHDREGLQLIDTVGLFSPSVTADIARGRGRLLRAYMAEFGAPQRAGNLCASFRGRKIDGILMTDSLYEQAVAMLLETRGEVLNGHLPTPL